MSLRSRVLPALYNGVSQQPPILRSPDQHERELNTWAVLSEGVSKRPPSEWIADLGAISDNALVHHINRDATERFVVVVDQTGVRVYDQRTGAQQTVNAPGGYGYLAGGKFRAVTVADYTFIVNTERPCALAAAGADTAPDPAFYRWPNNQLTGADAVWGALGMAILSGSELQYRTNPTGGFFAGEVPSIEKLPETAPNGALYKITGSIETGFVSFWVRRNGAVWDETVAPNQVNALNSETMPHCLVREADGTFTFAPFSWAPRRVGDEQTNPAPTFIGRTIRDVFFYQNRLGFLVDENVVFSCSGDFGNFWRNTVLDYVATDVVDVAAATKNVALLNYAVPMNHGILCFADQTQFSLTNGEDGLTPESVAIQPVMHYEVNPEVRPVQIGTEVYFCGDQNSSSVVWEYTRMEEAEALAAAEITAHVPRYLPKGLKQLIPAANNRALFAVTGGPSLFPYQFYWNGNEKLQSAWREWRFDGDVLSGTHIDGELYLIVRRGGTVSLQKINLEIGAKPAEQLDQVYLDRRVALTGTYDPVNDYTQFVIPYAANQARFQLVRSGSHPSRPGSLVDPSTYTWFGPSVFRVPGNELGVCTGGETYDMELQFSRQFPVDFQNRPVTTGRLQLRTFTVYFTDTAYFRTKVAPYGAALAPDQQDVIPAKLADFTGKVVGRADLILNRPVKHTGSYSFQVYGDAAQATITLTNDTHVGCTFVSAEWEGFYYRRS